MQYIFYEMFLHSELLITSAYPCVVYLLYLKMGSLLLVEFALLKDNEKEAIKEALNEVTPYRIKLDEDAMFNVLAEIEGYRHLHEKVFIEFDCGVKFRVYNDRKYMV